MLQRSIRLATVAGIPIGVHWSLLVVAGFLTWTLADFTLPAAAPGYSGVAYLVAAVVTAAVFFGSVAAHELGHALVALRHGVKVDSITLWLFGGVAQLHGDAPTAKAELQIAASGPGVSVALSALFLGGAFGLDGLGVDGLLPVVLFWLGLINGVLAVFNLLPGAPLDGGRILSAVVWWRTKDRAKARLVAARAGTVVGALLVGLPLIGVLTGTWVGGLWTMLVGWFVLMASRAEADSARITGTLDLRTAGEVMTPHPPLLREWATVAELDLELAWVPPGAHPYVVTHGFEGYVSGVVAAEALRRIPWEQRAEVRLRDLMVPYGQLRTCTADEPVLDVLQRPGPASPVILVFADDRIVGVISRENLVQGGPAPVRPPARV